MKALELDKEHREITGLLSTLYTPASLVCNDIYHPWKQRLCHCMIESGEMRSSFNSMGHINEIRIQRAKSTCNKALISVPPTPRPGSTSPCGQACLSLRHEGPLSKSLSRKPGEDPHRKLSRHCRTKSWSPLLVPVWVPCFSTFYFCSGGCFFVA